MLHNNVHRLNFYYTKIFHIWTPHEVAKITIKVAELRNNYDGSQNVQKKYFNRFDPK